MKLRRLFFFMFSISAALFICFVYIYDAKYYPIAYAHEIKEYSDEFDADSALIASIINSESGFDRLSVSSYGAIGLMQLIPSTAEWVASELGVLNFNAEMLYDPNINIRFGTYYYMYLYKKFNSVSSALASYNAGEGVVSYWLDCSVYSSDGINIRTTPYPATNAYLEKVMRNYDVYKTKLIRALKT